MSNNNPGAVSREMPRFISQKVVHALKIAFLQDVPREVGVELIFEDKSYAPLTVSREWVQARGAQPGGYYVVYGDGYTSWSPAEAFEKGNTPAEEWGIRRPQEPKYAIGERGRIVNRRTGRAIPDDEPVFILRAQDKLALQTLLAYRSAVGAEGLNPDSIGERILAFSAFAERNPDRMKLPNVASVVVPYDENTGAAPTTLNQQATAGRG